MTAGSSSFTTTRKALHSAKANLNAACRASRHPEDAPLHLHCPQRAGFAREAHAPRRSSHCEHNTAGARHAACASVAAPGTLQALEAQMRVAQSLNSKSAARLEVDRAGSVH